MCTAAKKARSPHQPTGCWIKPKKRLAIYLRDSFRCVYCSADLHGAKPFDITLDHVVPKIDGGSNMEDNLVTACRACNCSRQDRTVADFVGGEDTETFKAVARNIARPLITFLTMAAALIEGKTGDANS